MKNCRSMMCDKHQYYMNPDRGIHCWLQLCREYSIGKVGLEPDFKGIRNVVIQKGKWKSLKLTCGESRVLNGKDTAAARPLARQTGCTNGAERCRAE